MDELKKGDKATSNDLLQENKDLIQRLYSLALSEQDAARQEQHLESLASSVGAVDDMELFLSELLDKRVQLIDEAVTHGELPIAVKYESMLKRAENDLGSEAKKQAALAAIDDVSTKLAKLDDSSKQLPRALLAEVHARTAAVQIGEASLNNQIPKAEVALKRADSIVKNNSADPGVTALDLMEATEELKKMKKPKK